ncbi:MAG: F0F1 ATP synthase subunit A [Chloroflexi bacterium]|nr:F0F1 ATP synthase subunit A [Chloroflexota bacterium]
MVFNLPIVAGDAELVKATGPILSGDGFKIIPPRKLFAETRDFSYDAFAEPLVIEPGADRSVAQLCLIECEIAIGDFEPAVVPTTVNTAHLGFILRMEEKGYVDEATGETTGTVGHIFPIFRALASDVNLPLALALWSFLAVQYFGMRGVGIGANFGKYIGVGSHAIVKGPMGVFVGILEIVSEVGRVISFTFRLFGNIFAGEVVLFISMFLVAFVVPTVFFGLEVFVGFIQAFVFAMLTLVFASTAVGDHDEHHDEAAEH